MPNAYKWSNEQVFQMYSAWVQGESLRSIGARHGITGQRVRQLISRLQISLMHAYRKREEIVGPFGWVREPQWDKRDYDYISG